MNKRIFLFLMPLLLFAPNAAGQSDSFTTYYGRTIHLGDTLWVGAPEYCKSIFLSELSEREQLLPAEMSTYFYQPLVVDSLPQNMEYKDNNYSNHVIHALCSAPNGTRFLINIDNAIYNNELQMGMPYNDSYRKTYSELTDLVKLLYYIHTEQIAIDDNSILRYMHLVNPELGKTCEHDKFTFRRERDHYLSLLQGELSTFPKRMENTVYYYPKRLESQLGNNATFNPDINGYLITKLYDCQSSYQAGYNTSDIVLLYQPCETILEMSEAGAELYERKLKGDGEILYRQECAMVYVNLMTFDKESYVGDEFVCALFLGAELFDHPSCMYNYLGNVSYDPQHYEKVLKRQKKELRKKKAEVVSDGIRGILSLF